MIQDPSWVVRITWISCWAVDDASERRRKSFPAATRLPEYIVCHHPAMDLEIFDYIPPFISSLHSGIIMLLNPDTSIERSPA